MNGGLDFVSQIVVPNPDDAIASLPSQIENSYDIATAQVRVNARQQRTAKADITHVRLLQKALAPRVYTPNGYFEIDLRSWLGTAVDPMNNSHISLFTVVRNDRGVKITPPTFGA